MKTNQEILDNAPEGATHVDDEDGYLKTRKSEFWDWVDGEWDYLNTCVEDIRSLADIERIVELEKELESFNAEHSLHCKIIPSLEAHNLEQQKKCIEGFFNSIEPKISMGKSKLWEVQTHNVDCYLDSLIGDIKALKESKL